MRIDLNHPLAFDVEVFHNGKKLKTVIEVDTDQGWTREYHVDEDGDLSIHPIDNNLRIIWRDRPGVQVRRTSTGEVLDTVDPFDLDWR